jgi:hypothetical protein
MTDEEVGIYLTGLLDQSREKVEMNYLLARERGDDDPVVLLLDAGDPRARAMLDRHAQADRIAAMVARAKSDGCALMVICGLPRREALGIAAGHLPGLEAVLDDIDVGEGYLAVVVGGGGYAVEAMPPLPE